MSRSKLWSLLCVAPCVLLCGCVNDTMWQDARLKPMEPSPIFYDGSSARPQLADTVARGHANTDRELYEGRGISPSHPLVDTFPFPITRAVLDRGEQRFDIYCSPCHGLTGVGNGMIVQRGFPPPPSYTIPRLRTSPVGHFYEVMTNGYGVMYSYSDRLSVEDRWAVAAYIRVLQARHIAPEISSNIRSKSGSSGGNRTLRSVKGRP